jgi:hypothetical protein
MPLWGNVDNAANSDIAVLAQVNRNISSAERSQLYGNVAADGYFTGATVGQFGISVDEQEATAPGTAKAPHAGWNLRTVGSGGRAGRVHYETLVAMGSMIGDGTDDDTVLPDRRIIINSQPAANTGNSTLQQIVTFSVGISTVPPGGAATYLWQYTTDPGNTATWATTGGVSGFSGTTISTLSVNTAIIADNTLVRAAILVAGTASVTSDPAELTVVS